MGLFDFIVSIVAIGCGAGVLTEYIKHRTKIAEMRLKLAAQPRIENRVDDSAIQQLRDEIHSLRDTTTQYDISFDSALQRLEQRIEQVERRGVSGETSASELRLGK